MTRDALKEIGLDVDEVIAAAERAGPAAAAQLAYEVDVALSALEDGYGELVESPELPRAVSAAASRQAREVQRAASALKAGRITQAQFNRRVHEAIATNFRSAYDATMRRPLSPGDELWLSRAVEAEFEFARGFGQDIVEGNIRMPIHKRSEMYGQTVHGIAWNAEVEKHGSDTRIFWRLGQAEHCDDCILLASSSPYTKNSLPTTPKAGATQCRCVATPSARVLTRRGPIPIVDVVAGDRVLTHKGRWRRVEKTHRFENDRALMDLKAPTGRIVRFTADHWFMTKRGWVPLREIDRARLSMYAANHELLKMWSQDSQRRGQWTVPFMPANMPDMWGEKGSPGKRVPFVWYESQGKITMGAFEVTQATSWWPSRSWFGKAASVFRSCTRRFYESEVGRAFLRDVSIWWSQGLGLSVPLVVGASTWADWRWDDFASQKWRLHRRSVGESGVVDDWRTCANAFRKRKQSTMERRTFGLELPGVRQEVQAVFEEGEAPQVLFAGVPHKSTTILYDLTVEEDHSFVVEGLVSHNSNCKCRLEFRSGRKNRDAEQADARRDERLIDMLRPPGAPPGLRPPTIGEAAYIADLRAQINFNRRLIAMATDEKAIRAAAAARKAANAELIEFLEQQGIYEVPVWSVDEVVTGADIGGVAERDLFIHGIDGASLDVLSESQLRRLITQYEDDMGEAFPKAYSRPSIKDEARRATRQGGLAAPTPVAEEYQIVGEGLKDTKWILGRLMLAARGADVQVGPYRDEFVDGAYAWAKGSEAVEVVERLSEAAKDAGIRFVVTPVELQRRRDHASTTVSERKVQDRERSVHVRQQEESRAGICGVPGEEKRASNGATSRVEGNFGSCLEGNCGCDNCRGR